jgi:hypothetical protein
MSPQLEMGQQRSQNSEDVEKATDLEVRDEMGGTLDESSE